VIAGGQALFGAAVSSNGRLRTYIRHPDFILRLIAVTSLGLAPRSRFFSLQRATNRDLVGADEGMQRARGGGVEAGMGVGAVGSVPDVRCARTSDTAAWDGTAPRHRMALEAFRADRLAESCTPHTDFIPRARFDSTRLDFLNRPQATHRYDHRGGHGSTPPRFDSWMRQWAAA